MFAGKTADGDKKLWSSDHILEDGAWVAHNKVVQRSGENCRKSLDARIHRTGRCRKLSGRPMSSRGHLSAKMIMMMMKPSSRNGSFTKYK